MFSLVMKKEAGELDYTQDEALVPGAQFPDSPGPKVELHCLNYLASEEESGDKTGAEAEFIAARIERLLREASVTENGALRPAKPSDIVILMRSPGMIAGVYQAALQRRGIACDVGGDGDLMQTAEIEILFQLLQIIDNPHRDIPLAAAMASPVFGFTPEELALLRAQAQKADLYDCLCACREPSEKLCAFLSWLSRMREESRRTPLPELLNTVVQSSGLEMVFAALPDGERRRGSLAAFASFVTAGAQTELRSLSELVQLLLQMQQRGARLPAQDAPARSDAVRIMSIHKSKGLEFPIVILADLARKMNMQDNAAAVLTDEELLIGGNVVDLASRSYYHGLARRAIIDRKTAQTVSEELRVLYVAMTRAKEQLYLTCAERRLLYGRTQYSHPSRFVDEMPEELLESNITESRRFSNATAPDPTLSRPQVARARYVSAANTAPSASLASAAKSKPLPNFAAGDRVFHKAFGDGLIVSVKPMGGDALLEIAFDQKGTKRLMAKSAGQFMHKL